MNLKKCEIFYRKHTDITKLPVLGWDRTYNALFSIVLNQRIIPPCQPGTSINMNEISSFKILNEARYMGYKTDTFTLFSTILGVLNLIPYSKHFRES